MKTMRDCDNQAGQPCFYGQAVKGEGDLPPITMQVLHTFQPRDVFVPCP